MKQGPHFLKRQYIRLMSGRFGLVFACCAGSQTHCYLPETKNAGLSLASASDNAPHTLQSSLTDNTQYLYAFSFRRMMWSFSMETCFVLPAFCTDSLYKRSSPTPAARQQLRFESSKSSIFNTSISWHDFSVMPVGITSAAESHLK